MTKKDGPVFAGGEFRENSEEVTPEPRPALSENASHAKAWMTVRILGRENGKCKSTEAWIKEL